MQGLIRLDGTRRLHWREGILAGALITSVALGGVHDMARAEHSHTVGYGDTLSHIAVNYGYTVQELVLLNGMENPDLIFPGEDIALGGHGNATEAASVEDTWVEETVAEETWVDEESADESAEVSVAQGAAQEWPPYVEQWYIRELLVDAAHRYGWDPTLIMAQAWQESAWRQDEISWTGAIGVLQIMPGTAAEMEDWYFQRDMDVFMSVEDNIEMGVAYLSVLYEETGSVELALASYYQGWWSVQNDGFFPDTDEYVERIFMFQEMFKNGELP